MCHSFHGTPGEFRELLRTPVDTVLSFLVRMTAGLLLAGLLSVLLVRCSPGFGVDERELDPGLSEATRASIRGPLDHHSILANYGTVLFKALHGDLGYSSSLNAPVTELIAQRAAVTARSVLGGLTLAWAIALPMAVISVSFRLGSVLFVPVVTLLMCVPVGLIAVYFFVAGLPAAAVVAAGVAPKVFTYVRQLLTEAEGRSHVFGAIARGLPAWRVFWMHRALPVAPEVLALLAVSVTIALGAAIPAEALCDVPGLGQLAWKASFARDTPALLAITWLLTAMAFTANTLSQSFSRSEKTWRE